MYNECLKVLELFSLILFVCLLVLFSSHALGDFFGAFLLILFALIFCIYAFRQRILRDFIFCALIFINFFFVLYVSA